MRFIDREIIRQAAARVAPFPLESWREPGAHSEASATSGLVSEARRAGRTHASAAVTSRRSAISPWRAAVVLGQAPLGADPAAPLQAVERRIERALLDEELGVA